MLYNRLHGEDIKEEFMVLFIKMEEGIVKFHAMLNIFQGHKRLSPWSESSREEENGI